MPWIKSWGKVFAKLVKWKLILEKGTFCKEVLKLAPSLDAKHSCSNDSNGIRTHPHLVRE